MIVGLENTSTKYPKYCSKLIESGYRRLKCTKCVFEEKRDEATKLNVSEKHRRS